MISRGHKPPRWTFSSLFNNSAFDVTFMYVGEGASGGGGDDNADADGEGVPGGDDVVEPSPPKSGGKKGRKSKGKGKKKGGSGEGEEEDEDALGTSHVRVGFLCRAMRRRVHEPS